MNGIIKGLVSETEPKIQNWGEKRHVPINVRQEKSIDEKGEALMTSPEHKTLRGFVIISSSLQWLFSRFLVSDGKP